MQGLHLTGDLYNCNCSEAILIDLPMLEGICRQATLDAGLTIVDDKFFLFPDVDGQPGGITGTLLLAESHLAIHTWPERRGVTLDVYVCNYMQDNSGKARALFDRLVQTLRPETWQGEEILRGDLAQPEAVRRELLREWSTPNSVFGTRPQKQLEARQTEFQRVDVYDTPDFGRLFRLDGRFMTSERDEFIYHECMVHPAALAHAAPRRALVLGGGDGGSSEELLKHPGMERVVMAELDPAVIEIAKAYLQRVHRGVFDDPRLEVKVGDGFAFVRDTDETFDLIVLDLTDPDTPAEQLYTADFFRMCQRILAPGGALSLHIGSPVYGEANVRRLAGALREVFTHVRPMTAFVPLYGSLWAMAVASDALDPAALDGEQVDARLRERGIDDLAYYDGTAHPGLFALPRYVRRLTDPAAADAAH
ncbi:polyamine aminopropyltransferase [Verticiella sediminum]|uniref:Polyamine aminopropyltransferase n=1 Tax=Verticiella sediminum TaxID=1247510 RepID=A0A556AMQ5_9BURK|nr:polyamine aminopropyltransferase [Verticiella sediminum]TSH94169.1 polyamine aminopropyltransferase [Verticiella sediminum]